MCMMCVCVCACMECEVGGIRIPSFTPLKTHVQTVHVHPRVCMCCGVDGRWWKVCVGGEWCDETWT
eukprot:m.352799 g.352799  ORF g.352799 m.352799 type:complete len:66 (-) comp16614_c0_seq1:1839-2036(-)